MMARVFIVDDDRFIHKVLERILSFAGHTVVGHAYNGKEAVEQFLQIRPPPDIVLMDHRMPLMNGLDATREILQMNPSAAIIFVSADETVSEEATEAGAKCFLTKPIRSNTLFDVIRKYAPEAVTEAAPG